ncbi:MAG: murein L,D-transpeptidase [Sebaldella sp.]|nr:murein L,D-transpeptidase [Sebaldella sp.]
MKSKKYIFLFGVLLFIVTFLGISNKTNFENVIGWENDIENSYIKKNDINEKGTIKLGNPVYIRIFKEEGKLEIWAENSEKTYTLYKTYDICTYSGGLGPKKKEGDKKTPEGFYSTKKSSLNPNSSYHLSFNIGYPNAYDKAHGYTGSLIMVHGNCVSIGCFAMTDKYIEEIYSIVERSLINGQNVIDVHVFPFKMTNKNMSKYSNSEYYNFWEELKPAYDNFEKKKVVPKIKVINKKYVIE